jgi:type I restriction enzyme M protein
MAKKEVRTDLWVAEQLKESGIDFDPQGSTVKGLDEALKTASKRGNVGFPEYTAVIGDFVLVIEDKSNLDKHIKLNDNDVIASDTKALTDYAVNGAWFYAKHIAENSDFHEVFAVGVSGDEKHHRITPLFVNDREGYKQLDDLESFISFSPDNIREYYERNVLNIDTDVEKTTEQILKDAAELHNDLRNYGALKDQDKPLVVAGILLALDEIEHRNFSIDDLVGDQVEGSRDGDKIMKAIESKLKRANVGPETKVQTMLGEFQIIRNSFRLNEKNSTLGMTPLKHYAQFLYKHVYNAIKYQKTSEDFIGRFYGEFMSYSGGDGQTLGIILTPRHITDLMCEILNVGPEDKIIDPCCGTAGFLISAMHRMLSQATNEAQRKNIKKKQLYGFEIQSNMFVVAASNMIIRKDGNSNLKCCDFLKQKSTEVQLNGATVGLMNPPYSQGSKDNPSQYEMSFVEHLLDSLTEGARAAVIVPQSSMTGKTKYEQQLKESILKKHTLEGVVTCNTDTFYGVGVNPVIAIFTAHEPHDPEHVAKFIDFRDDGYEVSPHVGLIEGNSAKDKKQHLLDVWNGKAETSTKFCVESTVIAEDEWLHSFYYFNDEIPTDSDFDKAIGDYLTFEFSMIMQGRGYLFEEVQDDDEASKDVIPLDQKKWEPFALDDIFTVSAGKRLETRNKVSGSRPFIGATDNSNGVTGFVGNDNASKDSNVLGVNYNGAPCIAFYHPYECIFTDDVKRLHLRSYVDNKFVLLFFTAIFAQQRSKYSYGYKFKERRMLQQKILLPINNDGEPDYEYMEQYIRNMMIRKCQDYLNYLDK